MHEEQLPSQQRGSEFELRAGQADRMQREGNGLDLAVKKFRMAAYLWQAFTGEQMNRYKFGRRCFRFEDSWEPGTLSYQDWGTNQFRTQAKVHVIRSNKSVAEIRDLERAQQYTPGLKRVIFCHSGGSMLIE